MSRPRISRDLRARITEESGWRCGYCLTEIRYSGMRMEVEHLHPYALRGASTEDNLWLSCSDCNAAKGRRIQGLDRITNQLVSIFNPRAHHWRDHFRWSASRTEIEGLTPIGRVTVELLQLNRDELLVSRAEWLAAGWRPAFADG